MRRIVCTCFTALLFLALALPAQAGYERINEPNPEDPLAVQIYRLENGLTVYLTEYHQEPRFYAEIAVRAGSKMDPSETTGLAHYLEHLLFKGTTSMGTTDWPAEKPFVEQITELYEEHFKEQDPTKRDAIWARINEITAQSAALAIPNELDRLYKGMGGDMLNAHTWHEETVYKVGLPSNRLKHWAVIESERFREPVFRLFQTELETVYEEMNRALDNKHRLIQEAVDERVFKHHPYGQQTTLGSPEHLKNPSIRNIQRYYQTWYVPNNMGIFISGDIDPEETMEIIDQHFSAWKPRELPEAQTWDEDPIDGREFVEVTYEGEEYALLAFRTVPVLSEEAEALQLVDMLLDNATAGLINLNLNQAQKVQQAGSYPMMLNDYGVEYLWGIPKEGQTLEEVEKLLLEQIEKIKAGEFEDWILPAIVNDFEKQMKTGLESNESRVDFMRQSYIQHDDWNRVIGKIARLRAVTREQIVAAANKYFGGNYVAGYRKDAPHKVLEVQKPQLASIDIDPSRASQFAQQVMSMPVVEIEPTFVERGRDFESFQDPRGVDYYYVENPVNDVFSFSITVDLGTHEENRIGLAAALMDKAGTQRLSAEDLRKEWYKLGTDFSIASSDNETVIALRGLDKNFEASVKLLMEVLHTATADESTLAQLKEIVIQAREDAKKDPGTIASALVEFNRYGQDSYYLKMLSTEAVRAQDRATLFGIIGGLLDYRHTVNYCGTLTMDEVRRIVEEAHPIEAPLKEPPAYNFRRVRTPEQSEVYLFDKDLAQANIRLEFGSVDYNEDITPAVQLYNNYFAGGMAGIVFQELREARALAYVVGAHYIEGERTHDQNVMMGVIQTQTDKTTEALQGFIGLLDKLPESPERFAIAKDALINLYRTGTINFRDVIGVVRSWQRRGLEPDPRKERFVEIQAAELPAVMEFYREYIADHPKLISIVGATARMELPVLESLGTVRVVTTEDLFVE
ncbi:MAG: insulinase family protein [Candidatus Hydrogenedentes bacterium]|nr:insulinase family protein [Candidatus Hydrogenedentota bacterium]